MLTEKQAVAKARRQELQWQAEDDARVIKRYAELNSNAARRKRADTVLQKELQSLQSAIGKSNKPKNNSRSKAKSTKKK